MVTMLLKLYKREEDRILYWEAWDEESEITVHFGELGDTGDTTTIVLAEFEPPKTAIEREAAEARAHGFHEIEHEELYELVVRLPADALQDDCAHSAESLEEALNETLGWTGNGHCDSHEICEDSVSVYAFVVEPKLAVKPIVEELEANGLSADAVIAYQEKDETFKVLWPEGFDGEFEY